MIHQWSLLYFDMLNDILAYSKYILRQTEENVFNQCRLIIYLNDSLSLNLMGGQPDLTRPIHKGVLVSQSKGPDQRPLKTCEQTRATEREM